MPPWPNAALEVPLQMCMEAIHIFPFKERRMLPVMEKLNRSCYIINTNTIYLFVYCSKTKAIIYIYNIYLKNIQYASVYIMTCIRGNNLPKCECLKMRTPSIFKSLLNPLLEGFFNPTTNQPTPRPTPDHPNPPPSVTSSCTSATSWADVGFSGRSASDLLLGRFAWESEESCRSHLEKKLG